ncbi:MAG: serine hydrolase domain-containing protein [Traorella sp.]
MNYNNLDKLDNLVNQLMKEGISAGINMAVVTPTEKWFKTYGNRQNIPTVEKATLDTIWDLASCSKVLVTTTCILKLREEGLLDLDTKVKDILPKLSDETLTIKECITHTSGFPADIDGYKKMSMEEMIESVWKMKKVSELEHKVNYSDVNFILLGWVIAKLKGSLDGYAKEVMFEPLQMNNTCYNPKPELKERCAAYEDIPARGGVVRGVVHDGKGYKFMGISGHAGVFSTIEDISHYVEMLLNDGIYHGVRFFREDTMNLLKTCTTVGMNEKRSIGWVISDPNYALGKKFSEHTLYHTGFSGPSILIDLDKKIGCIVLANRVHPTRDNKKILTARNDIHDAVYALLD